MAESLEDSLRANIKQMSTEEIRERLMEVRQARRSGGRNKKDEVTPDFIDNLTESLKGLSKEQRKKLMEDLLGE